MRRLLDRRLSAAVALIVILLSPSRANGDQVLFSDDFDDGTSDGWEIVELGLAEVVDGSFCMLTYCEP